MAAQKLRNRTVNKSNEQLISELKCLLEKQGGLSVPIIEKQPGMASTSAYRRRFGSIRQSYILAGRHLLKDLSGVDRRVRFQYLKDRLLQELVAACDSQSLPVIQNRHKHHCLAIWGHDEFRIGLAESVGQRGKYKWIFRTSGWHYPRQPLILGLLSADNLRVDKIGLMFVPPIQRSYFSFHDDVIAKTAILKQTAGEIVAAIASKESL